MAGGLFVCWTLFLGGPQGIGGLRGLFLPVNLRGLWGTWGDSFSLDSVLGRTQGLKGLEGTSGDSGDSGNLRGLRAP